MRRRIGEDSGDMQIDRRKPDEGARASDSLSPARPHVRPSAVNSGRPLHRRALCQLSDLHGDEAFLSVRKSWDISRSNRCSASGLPITSTSCELTRDCLPSPPKIRCLGSLSRSASLALPLILLPLSFTAWRLFSLARPRRDIPGRPAVVSLLGTMTMVIDDQCGVASSSARRRAVLLAQPLPAGRPATVVGLAMGGASAAHR